MQALSSAVGHRGAPVYAGVVVGGRTPWSSGLCRLLINYVRTSTYCLDISKSYVQCVDDVCDHNKNESSLSHPFRPTKNPPTLRTTPSPSRTLSSPRSRVVSSVTKISLPTEPSPPSTCPTWRRSLRTPSACQTWSSCHRPWLGTSPPSRSRSCSPKLCSLPSSGRCCSRRTSSCRIIQHGAWEHQSRGNKFAHNSFGEKTGLEVEQVVAADSCFLVEPCR